MTQTLFVVITVIPYLIRKPVNIEGDSKYVSKSFEIFIQNDVRILVFCRS